MRNIKLTLLSKILLYVSCAGLIYYSYYKFGSDFAILISCVISGIPGVAIIFLLYSHYKDLFDVYREKRIYKKIQEKIQKLEENVLFIERQIVDMAHKKDALFEIYKSKFKPESKENDVYNEEMLVKMLSTLERIDKLIDTLQMYKEHINQNLVFQRQSLHSRVELEYMGDEEQLDRILRTIRNHDILEDTTPDMYY